MRNIVLSAVIIIAAGTSYFTYTSYLKPNPITAEGNNVGDIFIDLEVPLITGETLQISDLEGDLIILDFMAPWCPPCKEQIQVFKYISEIGDVSIVSINIDPRYDMDSLRDIAEEEGVTWFYGHLPQGSLEYEINAIPVVVFIDRSGVIRYRGFFTPIERLELLISQFK